MQDKDLAKVIQYLKPSAQFSFTENDYSSIKWDVLEGNAPTETQILEAWEVMKEQEAKQIETKATQKAALLAKLGINEDEASLLLS